MHPDWFRYLPNLNTIHTLTRNDRFYTRSQLQTLSKRVTSLTCSNLRKRFKIFNNLRDLTIDMAISSDLKRIVQFTRLESLKVELLFSRREGGMQLWRNWDFKGLSALSSLTSLSIAGTDCGSFAAKVSSLRSLTNLRKLKLSGLYQNPSVQCYLEDRLVILTQLTHLILQSRRYYDNDDCGLGRGCFSDLSELRLLHIKLSYYDADQIARGIAAMPNLTSLVLGARETASETQHSLRHLTNLTCLDVHSYKWIDNETLAAIGGNLHILKLPLVKVRRIIRFPNRTVTYQKWDVPHESRITFGLEYLTALTELDLRDNAHITHLPDHFATHLRRLKHRYDVVLPDEELTKLKLLIAKPEPKLFY